MKKIGVITFYKSENYGAFLQCFALQKILQRQSIDASVIAYENPADAERYKFISLKKPKKTIKNIITFPFSNGRRKNFKRAQEKLNYSMTTDSFDVAITGSDQVWNPNLTGGSIDKYFTLEKIKAKKKISYAASIGDEKTVKETPDAYKKLMLEIDRVSVREQQAKEALLLVTEKDIATTIDPTALIARKDWLKYISNISVDSKPYVFSYFIGIRDDQAKALSKICKKTGLKTLSFTHIPKEKHIYKYCYSDGPFEFLARLRDAKLVITSSFHGTILSIIFHKNFYVLMPNTKNRSRMDNILKLTGLTDRIIETEADIDKINLKDIDYTEPQKKLDKLRQESLDWLKNAIEN